MVIEVRKWLVIFRRYQLEWGMRTFWGSENVLNCVVATWL